MNSKLNCVLLIDDDQPTNFLSNLVLEEAACTSHIQIEQSGQKALEYLSKNAVNNNGVAAPGYPDLIFLDINMPAMNGWEFLDKFGQLKNGRQAETVIIMLTTSINPDDKMKAEKTSLIAGFENKPLTNEIIEKVIQKYFSQK